MPGLSLFIVSLFAYVLLARLALAAANQRARMISFAGVNIAGFAWLSLLSGYSALDATPIIELGPGAVLRHLLIVAIYVVVIAAGYPIVRVFARRDDWKAWLAFAYPILILVAFKYFFFLWQPLFDALDWDSWIIDVSIIGLSYMAFRLSHLAIEVRNGTAEMPSLSEYLGFAYFLPTMLVGPINPFSSHQGSISGKIDYEAPLGRCFLRILVGATKYIFLANLANQLSYQGLFQDGSPRPLMDVGVAAVLYYVYLYLNFSGICDIAIGIAGLLRIRVIENFDNPFLARNIKDFWNRWHISLSVWARDVIFSPLSKSLIRRFGAKHTNAALTASTFIVFLVIGVWHGVGWRFALFGVIHAAGVIANYYYTIFLKKRLGKEGFRRYNNSRLVHAVAIVLTFAYVTASFAVFANNYDHLGMIKYAVTEGLLLSGDQ